LLRDGEALIGAVRVLPGSAHVAGNVVSKIGESLTIYFGLKIGGFGASVEEKTVKDGDVYI
jgi:hypothetical protein